MHKNKLEDYSEILNEFKNAGWSSRQIATATGFSKSAINYFFAKQQKENPSVVVRKPKILILDLETSADIVATFGRRQVNISESNIIHQGNEIISAAWMWADDDNVQSSWSTFDSFAIVLDTEKPLIQNLVDLLEEADAVVIHNARFDLGTIQHRMLAHGMGRLPSVKVIDTLMIARKHLRLRSNKLDSITKYFGLSNKLENEGIKLWIDVQSGCPRAMERMVEYNEGDVEALKDVYMTFLPLTTTFNQGLIVEASSPVCGACGSTDVAKTGKLVYKTVTAYEEYVCNSCGARHQGSTNVISKEKKKSLLKPL